MLWLSCAWQDGTVSYVGTLVAERPSIAFSNHVFWYRVRESRLRAWKPPPITFCVLYSESSKLTPKIKVFLDFIEAYIGTDKEPQGCVECNPKIASCSPDENVQSVLKT
jgi:hypothetical protein